MALVKLVGANEGIGRRERSNAQKGELSSLMDGKERLRGWEGRSTCTFCLATGTHTDGTRAGTERRSGGEGVEGGRGARAEGLRNVSATKVSAAQQEQATRGTSDRASGAKGLR